MFKLKRGKSFVCPVAAVLALATSNKKPLIKLESYSESAGKLITLFDRCIK
jgi:hypothetical protein